MYGMVWYVRVRYGAAVWCGMGGNSWERQELSNQPLSCLLPGTEVVGEVHPLRALRALRP